MKLSKKIDLAVIIGGIIMVALSFPILAGNIKTAFTSQAPFGNWSEPWQNACEETSIVIINSYYNQTDLTTAEANRAILQIIKTKNKYFGQSLDENAEKITLLINNYTNWEARVAKNPSLTDIKNEINNSRPVIMPLHGKSLHNPYYYTDYVDYHTIVISGYDDENQQFITQEPGTFRGHDFRYSYQAIMDAMHDYLPGNTINGDKVAIFTSPIIETSAKLDGDLDGLTKEEELRLGTSLFSADTDRDGFKDGEEVKKGFSPLVAEMKLGNGDIIRSKKDNRVYLIEANKKRHITSLRIFEENGWNWEKVYTVSEKYLNNIKDGGKLK